LLQVLPALFQFQVRNGMKAVCVTAFRRERALVRKTSMGGGGIRAYLAAQAETLAA